MSHERETQSWASWAAFLARALLGTHAGELAALARQLPKVAASFSSAELAALLETDPIAIEKEYVRLFFNPQGSPCLLWQSARGEEARLMGASHAGALAWFRRFGAEPRSSNEPADHAGLLLAFWSHLLENPTAPEEVRAFYQEHVVWMNELADDLDRHARHPFYMALAQLIREILAATAPAGPTHLESSELTI